MAIKLKQFTGSLVTPKDDAVLYQALSTLQAGIVHGVTITIQNLNYVHITSGYGVICGRMFSIDEADVAVELPDADGKGQIYLHMDLSDATTPIQLISEAVVSSGSLTELTTNEDCNFDNGVYDLLLATYTCTSTAIQTLASVAPRFAVAGGILDSIEEIVANTQVNRIAGALAVKDFYNESQEKTLLNDTTKTLQEAVAASISNDTLPAHANRVYSFNTSDGWYSVSFSRSSDSYTATALPLSSDKSAKSYRIYGKVSTGADSVIPFSGGDIVLVKQSQVIWNKTGDLVSSITVESGNEYIGKTGLLIMTVSNCDANNFSQSFVQTCLDNATELWNYGTNHIGAMSVAYIGTVKAGSASAKTGKNTDGKNTSSTVLFSVD